MPVIFQFEEDQHIMFWHFSDPWTVPQLMAHYKESQSILHDANHFVHSLVDMQQARTLPSGVLQARYHADWKHPRSGYVAVIGTSLLPRRMLEMLFRLTQFERVRFFQNETAARAFLAELVAHETALEEIR
jgi:hypothetical protein